MKKLWIFFALILSFGTLRASHLAGAEINYRYIGDSTGIPYQYLVSLQIYRDLGGIALNTTTQELCVSSSCSSNQTYIFDFKPVSIANGGNARQALPVPGLTECVDPNDPDLVITEIYFFTKVVTLSGKCANWKFSWHDNARNTNEIDNLTFGTGGSDLYIEAILNNVLGHNSSPVFINPAAKSFCVGSPFLWSQAAVEPDGDSLYYDFGNPLVSALAPVCIVPSNAAFAAGYSLAQPMTTTGGITIDHRYGTFRFTPAQIENDVINVTVTEYRYDAGLQLWRLIGNTVRDLQIPIVGSCKASALAGPRIDPSGSSTDCIDTDSLKGYGFPKITNDSVPNGAGGYCYQIPVVPYNCFDGRVSIKFDIEVLCESISADGSEFRIIGPDSAQRPVVSVVKNCKPDLTTKQIELVLHQPLDINGDYYLQVKPGSDGNTLTNRCGFELNPYYMILIRVSDCPKLDYKLNNVSVNLDREIELDWEIDVNTFEPSLFNAWNILRANENDQYYILASLDSPSDINLRSFTDNTLKPEEVDLIQWQYRIQLVQNNRALAPTNRIHSILLSADINGNEDGNIYNWTEYDGWDSAAYELELGEFNPTTAQVDFENFAGPQQNYFTDEFIYPTCEEIKDTGRLYALRVLATDPNPGNSFVSESNWLYYRLTCTEPPTAPNLEYTIPTVFTPNGDGENDFFKISADYQNAEVSIFNRWGKPVFTSSGTLDNLAWDGKDESSGQLVADGVYYYIIKMNGSFPDGKGGEEIRREEVASHLTIFSNGTK